MPTLVVRRVAAEVHLQTGEEVLFFADSEETNDYGTIMQFRDQGKLVGQVPIANILYVSWEYPNASEE